jgi:hypothetical protein
LACVFSGEAYDIMVNSNKGIPQGSPISGILSNVYMLDFDIAVKQIAEKYRALYYRYCDDIVVVCEEKDKNFFENIIHSQVKKLHLTAQSGKTVTRKFTISCDKKVICDFPLQYLGFMFDGNQTVIRSSSFMRYLHRMNRRVELSRQTAKKYNKIRAKRNLPPRPIFREKLYSRYSYLGKRNFIKYALKAANIMNENAIRRQVTPLWKRLKQRIESAEKDIGVPSN